MAGRARALVHLRRTGGAGGRHDDTALSRAQRAAGRPLGVVGARISRRVLHQSQSDGVAVCRAVSDPGGGVPLVRRGAAADPVHGRPLLAPCRRGRTDHRRVTLPDRPPRSERALCASADVRRAVPDDAADDWTAVAGRAAVVAAGGDSRRLVDPRRLRVVLLRCPRRCAVARRCGRVGDIARAAGTRDETGGLMLTMKRKLFHSALVVTTIATIAPALPQSAAPDDSQLPVCAEVVAAVREDLAATAVFQKRVNDYVTMHRMLEGPLPTLEVSTDMRKVQAAMDALAVRIQAARKDARQGDIFSEAVARMFHRRIASCLVRADIEAILA